MGKFTSEKVFDGYSACFRQWKADGTHCKFLHGYAVSFKVVFEGQLDQRNWVFDFGGMKRAKTTIYGKTPIEYFAYLLDHTVIVSQDDPYMYLFKEMDALGVIQLRVLETGVGCELFAKHLFEVINEFLKQETEGRVKATQVTVMEQYKNSATYKL
ncbi:MAG: Cellulophaga phage phiST [Bacteroidota bacterium]|jgi:6-pyruvoyltetrahydropterin/6-carboxytetrahydropterin synthase